METCNPHLMKQFMKYLESCKNPDDLFLDNTRNRLLARLWMEKLCGYYCEHVEDQLLRNKYMWNFVQCVNKETLSGPFLVKPPEGKLSRDYFEHMKNENDFNKEMRSEGSSSAFTRESSQQNVIAALHELDMKTLEKSIKEHIVKKINKISEDPEWTTNIINLLGAISAELKGESTQRNKEHLENELERYRNFIKDYPDVEAQYNKQSDVSRRSFLLVHFQKDLVRLLYHDD
ncbi:uncharacterized protein LOC119682919 [Teleopsis dalmanni]|uniref:uncharacterized protein LOC119682919 n=1 Tax=Teleopsis dalmanni TaxID=139649 RepID=UPI0018CE8A42|nr:uncharacterized protein LOC119682919 [Teleopsis dalmanni]